MPIPLDIVKKYSPVFQFHEDEKCFPTSIENLLENSTLCYRNFVFGMQIDGQSSSDTPAIVVFNGYLYLVYQGLGDFHLYMSRSLDGSNWQDTQKLAGIEGGSPSLVVFQDKLWIIWHGVLSTQLWIAHSSDGLHWDDIRKITGQEGQKVTATVYQNQLFIIYTHTLSSRLWMCVSSDGIIWSTSRLVEGHFTSNPVVTTFKDRVFLAYIDPAVESFELSVATYSHGKWAPPQVLHGKQVSNHALTAIGGWLFMTYQEPKSLQFWASRSSDGVVWQDTQQITGQFGDSPSICAFNDGVYMVYRRERQLWQTSCEKGDLSDHPSIRNPTQTTLQTHPNTSYFIKVNESQFAGQPLPSSLLYYAIQEHDDLIIINYLILYGNQPGQTLRALRTGSEFNCIISTIGSHQGDLERFTITLQRQKNTFTIIETGFEAHGILYSYPPDQVQWEDTHAIVHPSLNSHACRNRDPADGPIVLFSQAGAVAIGDWVGSGIWWKPFAQGSPFKQLGLDKSGNPISDQAWSAFAGHLGEPKENSLVGATYFNGKELSPLDWAFVKAVYGLAGVLDMLPSNHLIAGPPTGPATRPWIAN